ncbi:MAG: hypothetical protein J7L15_08490, partial [Clostridiales bacterium]|nr:hypothetical protein [Clostridiales bacterium]
MVDNKNKKLIKNKTTKSEVENKPINKPVNRPQVIKQQVENKPVIEQQQEEIINPQITTSNIKERIKEDEEKEIQLRQSKETSNEIDKRKNRISKIYGGKPVMYGDIGSTFLKPAGQKLMSDNTISELQSPIMKKIALSKGNTISDYVGSNLMGAGGGIFQGSIKGIGSASKISELQQQRQYEKELGGWGKTYQGAQTASLAMRSLYAANLAKNVTLGAIGGTVGGINSAAKGLVSGGLGETTKGLVSGAISGSNSAMGLGSGTISGVQSTILGGAMSPLSLGLIATQLASSLMVNSKLKKLRTIRQSPDEIERKHSLSRYTDPMYKLGLITDQLKMPDQLEYQLLSFIEGHTSVLPSIYDNLNVEQQSKDKSSKKGQLNYDAKTNIEKKGLANTITDNVSLLFAKYDPSVQLMNALVGKISPRKFIEQLKGGPQLSTVTDKEAKSLSKQMGISSQSIKLLTIKSSNLIGSTKTYEEKMIMLTSGIYDINRLIGQETINIRSQGFGIDTKFGAVDKKKTLSQKIGGVITNIPGIGAIANIIHDSATLMGNIGKGIKGIINKVPEIAFGKKFLELSNDQEALDKEAGIYKSSQEKSTDFIAEGLPTLIEKIRSVSVSQLEMQGNIFNIVKEQYSLLYKVHTGKDKKIDYIETLKTEKEERIWDYSKQLMLTAEQENKALQLREDKRTAILEKNFSGVTSWILKSVDSMSAKFLDREKKSDEELRERFSSVFESLPTILTQDRRASSKAMRDENKANEILYIKKDVTQREQFSLLADCEEKKQTILGHKMSKLAKTTAANSVLLASFLGTGGIATIATGLVALVGGVRHMADKSADVDKIKDLRDRARLSTT